ncbi:MAG: Protein translocase subunit SecF [Elusimicrobia bacterium]|nr:Protein translocase subunit SecF [Elusimicrobiota bacterium]
MGFSSPPQNAQYLKGVSMQLFKNTNIDFIGKKVYCYGLSLLLILAGIFGILKVGPEMSIEFTGGTLLQIGFKELPPIDQIRSSLNEGGFEGFSLQTQPADHSIIVRLKQGQQSKEDITARLLKTLQSSFSGNVKELPDRVEFVGPVIGKKLAMDALIAILGSLLVIVIYVAIRFKNWIWGAVGVLALAHDVFITFGLLVFLHREITLVVIAALLTLAGYSINDTIVIFDRVRENIRSSRKESLRDLYNRSINETLSRTLITSFIALITSSSLFFGGEVLFDFAAAMTFGILIGSYSTIGVAITLIHQWEMARKA